MRIDVFHHISWDGEAPPWMETIKDEVGLVVEGIQSIMATLEELNAALGAISPILDKISADTDNLIAQLASIPPGGLTPEQQAAIDSAVESANAISARLQAIDDKVPEPLPTPPNA